MEQDEAMETRGELLSGTNRRERPLGLYAVNIHKYTIYMVYIHEYIIVNCK